MEKRAGEKSAKLKPVKAAIKPVPMRYLKCAGGAVRVFIDGAVRDIRAESIRRVISKTSERNTSVTILTLTEPNEHILVSGDYADEIIRSLWASEL